ncbi:hypothetical protein [Dehalogenimonas alkenigignens]|uniref:hypothetical protein n=1 Tax=Dehalogenimonas alkenigignens TaxID=1217799 RepID=UPI000D571BE2|nr:hypothetical protein [Dehalogenimonas alkenigignens]PVV83511.1 hypothetical protein DD509_06690 [Dehalogenimonas alkenigignens]
MSDEAAELLGETLAGAITAQGDAISAAIQSAIVSSMASFGSLILGFLLVAGLVTLAMVVKNADYEGQSNRDPILVIIAGLAVVMFSFGMIEPSFTANAVIQATPVAIAGLYLIVKASIFAISRVRGG